MYSSLPVSSSGGGGSGSGSTKKAGNFFIDTVVNETVGVFTYATFTGTINALYGIRTASGTCTVAVNINGTPVTGMSSISVTSTPQNVTASGANTFIIGDRITLVITSASTPTGLEGSLDLTAT